MVTFTFRIPVTLAGRLNSAQMRSWLADFVRCPNSLPPDPGSGKERVSLTLPEDLVREAAGYLRCSPSTALRRIAAERLGLRQATTAVRMTYSPAVTAAKPLGAMVTLRNSDSSAFGDSSDLDHASTPSRGYQLASCLIQLVFQLVIWGGWLWFQSRKAKAARQT